MAGMRRVKLLTLLMVFMLTIMILSPSIIPAKSATGIETISRYPHRGSIGNNEPVYYFIKTNESDADLYMNVVVNITLDVSVVVDTETFLPRGTCVLNVQTLFPNETPVSQALVKIYSYTYGLVGSEYTDSKGYIGFLIWGGSYFVKAYYDSDKDGKFDYYGDMFVPFFSSGSTIKVYLFPIEDYLGISSTNYSIVFKEKMLKIGDNWYVGVIPGLPSLSKTILELDPTKPGDIQITIKSKVAAKITTSDGRKLYSVTYEVDPVNYTDNLEPLVFILDNKYNPIDVTKIVNTPSNVSLKILAFDDRGLSNVSLNLINNSGNKTLPLKKDKAMYSLERAISDILGTLNNIEESLSKYNITIPRPFVPLKLYKTTIELSDPGKITYMQASATDISGKKGFSQIATLMSVNNSSDSIIVVDPLFNYFSYVINMEQYSDIAAKLLLMGVSGLSSYYMNGASLGEKYSMFKDWFYNYTEIARRFKVYVTSDLPSIGLLGELKPKAVIITAPLANEDRERIDRFMNYIEDNNITLILTPQSILDPLIINGNREIFYDIIKKAGLLDYYVAVKILSQVYPTKLLSIPLADWKGYLRINNSRTYVEKSVIQVGWQLGYAGMNYLLKELRSRNISLEYYSLLANQLRANQSDLIRQVNESLEDILRIYTSLANSTYIDGKLIVDNIEIPVSSDLIRLLVEGSQASIIAKSNDNLAIATRYDNGSLHVIYAGIASRDLGLMVELLDQKPKTYTAKTKLEGIRVSEEVVGEYQSIISSLVNYTKLLVNDTIIVPCSGYAIYNISDLKKGEVAVTVISGEGTPQVTVESNGLVLGEHNGKVYNTIIANASNIMLNISVDNPDSILVPVKIIARAKLLKPKPVIIETKGAILELKYNKTAYKLLGSPKEITVSLKKEDLAGISKLIVPLDTLPSRKIILDIESIIRNNRIDRNLDIILVNGDVGNMTLKITKDTNISNGTLEFKPIISPPALPENSYVIAPVVDLGPSGIVFNKPVTIEITYDTERVQTLKPDNNTAVNLSIAYYDYNNKTWIKIPTTIKDNHAIANTTHFTPFTLIATVIKVNQTTNNTNNNTTAPANNTTTTIPANTTTTTTMPTPTNTSTIGNQTTTTTSPTTTSTATTTQTTTTTTTTQTTTQTTTSPTTTTTQTTTATSTLTNTTQPATTNSTVTKTNVTTTSAKTSSTTTTSKTATVTPITSTSTQTSKTITVQQPSSNVITLPFIGVKLGKMEALILGSLILLAIILLIAAAAKRR